MRLCPKFLQEKIAQIPDIWWDIPPGEIEKFCFESTGRADETSRQIRLSFWAEYDKCQAEKLSMVNLDYVLHGVCTNSFFANIFCNQLKNVFYILSVPPNYDKELDDMLQLGLSHLRKILELPGNDAKILNLKFKIFQHIDERKKGSIIQRIDQRSVNINKNKTEIEIKGDSPRTLEQIKAEIAALESAEQILLMPGGPIIDITDINKVEEIDDSLLKFQNDDKFKTPKPGM